MSFCITFLWTSQNSLVTYHLYVLERLKYPIQSYRSDDKFTSKCIKTSHFTNLIHHKSLSGSHLSTFSSRVDKLQSLRVLWRIKKNLLSFSAIQNIAFRIYVIKSILDEYIDFFVQSISFCVKLGRKTNMQLSIKNVDKDTCISCKPINFMDCFQRIMFLGLGLCR